MSFFHEEPRYQKSEFVSLGITLGIIGFFARDIGVVMYVLMIYFLLALGIFGFILIMGSAYSVYNDFSSDNRDKLAKILWTILGFWVSYLLFIKFEQDDINFVIMFISLLSIIVYSIYSKQKDPKWMP